MKSYIEVFNEVDYNRALVEGYRIATNDEIKYYHQNILKGFHTGILGEIMVKETEDNKNTDTINSGAFGQFKVYNKRTEEKLGDFEKVFDRIAEKY